MRRLIATLAMVILTLWMLPALPLLWLGEWLDRDVTAAWLS